MASKPITEPLDRKGEEIDNETRRHPEEGLDKGCCGQEPGGRMGDYVMDQDDITDKDDVLDDDEFVKGRDKAV